jgi:hypothetical protein
MTDRSFEQANDESRARLARMATTLTATQLATELGEGWTVASALAHTGFWDRWQAERWTEILAGRWTADDASVIAAEHLANEALHPYWAGIDSEDTPALALEAATRLDALIAAAPDAIVDKLEGTPSAYLLHRHRHRGDHLDHIERSLAVAPPLDRSFVGRNAESRRRLADLVGRLTPADMAVPTEPNEEGSWNVVQILGHLAFWDRSMETRWLAAEEAAGNDGSPIKPLGIPLQVADTINGPLAALLAGWTDQAGMAVAAEALAAAEAVDALIESLADRMPGSLLEESPRAFQRWSHRDDHIGAIERALGR